MNGNLKTMADSQILSPRTPLDRKLGMQTMNRQIKQFDPRLVLPSSSFKAQMMPQNDMFKQNKPINDQEFKKRALIVQESLLSYIKNTDKSKDENKGNISTTSANAQQIKFDAILTKQKNTKEEEKISSVKNMLRNLN